MLTDINPKLPMRDKSVTREFYIKKLGFQQFGNDYEGYLMVQKDNIQIHFFSLMSLTQKKTMARSISEQTILITYISRCWIKNLKYILQGICMYNSGGKRNFQC